MTDVSSGLGHKNWRLVSLTNNERNTSPGRMKRIDDVGECGTEASSSYPPPLPPPPPPLLWPRGPDISFLDWMTIERKSALRPVLHVADYRPRREMKSIIIKNEERIVVAALVHSSVPMDADGCRWKRWKRWNRSFQTARAPRGSRCGTECVHLELWKWGEKNCTASM